MIPFAKWSQSNMDLAAANVHGADDWSRTSLINEVDVELTGLMGAIVESLMTASVVQLRSALEDVGKRWSDQQTVRQETYISREMVKIEERVMTAVADVLLPVMSDLHLREVMKEFAATLQKLLPEFGAQNLLIKAPQEFHEQLNEALHNHNIAASIEDCEDRDVTIKSSQVVLVASLDAWRQKLSELVTQ